MRKVLVIEERLSRFH